MPEWRDLRIWALVAAAVLVAVFAAWALTPLAGHTIVLETQGVDPTDPLRGDYVQLAYPVASVPAHMLPAPAAAWQEGSALYLVLGPSGREDLGGAPLWDVRRVEPRDPKLEAGEECIRGTVASADSEGVRLAMGVEAYFIQKDEDLSDWAGKDVTVELKVRGCEARISAIRLDGERWAG